MTDYKEILPTILQEQLSILPKLRANAADHEIDEYGDASMQLASAYLIIGISEYVVSNNIREFRSNLIESAKLRNELFDRFEKGDPISESRISMGASSSLFYALAAADFEIARELARKLGVTDKIDKKIDHPFNRAFGYTFKYIVLDDFTNADPWLQEFKKQCEKKVHMDWKSKADMFEAIMSGDINKANSAMEAEIRSHERMAKRGRIKGTLEEVLSVAGIALVNLARHYGLNVSAIPPLLPEDLLVPVETKK